MESGISVIVPLYNAENELRRCIESILNQTHRNLELILVNDGSSDHSGAICQEYAAHDPRVRVLHQQNAGVAAARNAGLRCASKEWISWVDADDWIEADMLDYLLHLAVSHQADIAQCGIFLDQDDRHTTISVPEDSVTCSPHQFDLHIWHNLAHGTCNKLYRAQILTGLVYCPDFPIGEDLFFNLGALRNTARITLGTEAKYHYVQRENSACHTPPDLCRLTSFRRMLQHAMALNLSFGDAAEYLTELQLRNDLDICSKIICFPAPEFSETEHEVRCEVRHYLSCLQNISGLSQRERLKLLLLGKFWPIYHSLLLLSKKMGGFTL